MVTIFSRKEPKKDLAIIKPKKIEEGEVVPDPNNPLTVYIQNFLHKQKKSRSKFISQGADSTVHVSEVFGIIALIYEKIRSVVEYKRDHLLRRNAIERIIKRLLWERQGRNLETTAHLLLRELIWAHYLPNDHIPQGKIKEIASIFNKYLSLLNLLGGYNAVSQKDREWILGVASCDIEEALEPAFQRRIYVELMYEWFNERFDWIHAQISQHEKEVQLYLAIHRSLPKSDEPIMRYHLILKEIPTWNNPSKETLLKFAQNFSKLKQEIELHLAHKSTLTLFRYVKKHAPPFEILQDIVNKSGKDFFNIILNEEELELKIREMCQLRYTKIRQKVNRGIARSVVYIFVTKVLLALIIEIPYEVFILEHIAFIPIAINVVVPPMLMFMIGLTIKTPDEKNTKRLINRINNIVYTKYYVQKSHFSLKSTSQRTLLTSIFSFIYLALFIIIFGGISLFLYKLGFNIVSGGIFFVFLSLVLLFGFRVRSTASELIVTKDKEGIISYILSNLSLPFLNFGVLLSKGIAKLNVFMVIMDFLIEAPLKSIIEVIEEWTSFIREKREEVVDIPPE